MPTFAILNLPEWTCPAPQVIANMTYEDKTELWQMRMREIQGAIIVAAVFQVAAGALGNSHLSFVILIQFYYVNFFNV